MENNTTEHIEEQTQNNQQDNRPINETDVLRPNFDPMEYVVDYD